MDYFTLSGASDSDKKLHSLSVSVDNLKTSRRHTSQANGQHWKQPWLWHSINIGDYMQ